MCGVLAETDIGDARDCLGVSDDGFLIEVVPLVGPR